MELGGELGGRYLSLNGALREVWGRCRSCKTLGGLLARVGDIDEQFVVNCQRYFAVGTWERMYADFLWACSQCRKGRSEWGGVMQSLWTRVLLVVEQEQTEELFRHISL